MIQFLLDPARFEERFRDGALGRSGNLSGILVEQFLIGTDS